MPSSTSAVLRPQALKNASGGHLLLDPGYPLGECAASSVSYSETSRPYNPWAIVPTCRCPTQMQTIRPCRDDKGAKCPCASCGIPELQLHQVSPDADRYVSGPRFTISASTSPARYHPAFHTHCMAFNGTTRSPTSTTACRA